MDELEQGKSAEQQDSQHKWQQYAALKRLLETYGLLIFSADEYNNFNRQLLEILGL